MARIWFIVSILACWSQIVYGFDDKKCFGMYTKDGLRKYDYKYFGMTATTDTSTKEGTTKVSSENSTQGSTMNVDPTVSTKKVYSSTQYSSSFGECAVFGFHPMEKERQLYIAHNTSELKRQIASGGGHHVEAIRYLSGCNKDSFAAFAQALRTDFSSFSKIENDSFTFSQMVNTTIEKSPKLKTNCRIFPELS